DKLRAPFPPETGKNLVDAWGKNKFQVYDNLVQIDQNDASFTFKLGNEQKLDFDYVIKATGNDLNVTHDIAQVPLISKLANERIIQAELFDGFDVTIPIHSVVSHKHGHINKLKAHGQLIAGVQFGYSSVRIISKSAQASFESIVEKFDERKMV